MRFAVNPIQFFAQPDGSTDWDAGPGQDELLSAVAAAGFSAVQSDLRHAWEPEEYMRELLRHGIRPAPGYFSAPFEQGEARSTIEHAFDDALTRTVALGLKDIVVACKVTDARKRLAATQQDTPVDRNAVQAMAQALDAIGERAASQNVRIALHQHVGSALESQATLESVLAETHTDLVGLCPDTGHMAWGGWENIPEWLDEHRDRIRVLHVKDISRSVLRRGRQQQWGYQRFVRERLWREPGEGDLDLEKLLRDFLGEDIWCVIEVDAPGRPNPRDSLSACAAFVETLGGS